MTAGRLRFALALALVLLLEALSRFGVIDRFAMIPPSEILWHLGKILSGGEMWPAIGKTLTNVAMACIAAIIVGVILGTLIHGWRSLRETLDPLFAAYYAIPVYAFYPLFIVIFGLGDVPQVLIGFMLALVAVIVNTLNGLDRVPRVLIKTARIQRLGPLATALKITLPYAVPYIFTGVKLAVAYSFIGVIGAELIMSRTGLGYEIGFAYNNFDNAVMYPLIVLVLAIAATVNTMFFLWEKKMLARRRK
ncbi:MAG: ABC transporter permease subunit [Alphaproteobacteria bacterium]|nr:MAG: ABC transporter permease subunit [Alphaproteobacteria bacterium]